MFPLKNLLLLSLLVSLFFIACEKEENQDISTEDARISTDYAGSETSLNEVLTNTLTTAAAEPALNGVNGGSDDRGACPVITVTPAVGYPKTMTLDYGTGCTTTSGQTISGKVVAVFSGPQNQAGTTISIQLLAFKYQGYTLQGTYQLTVVGGGQWTGTITNGSATTPQGSSMTYAGTFAIVQVAGLSTTTTTTDDIFEISLDIAGTDTAAKAYTAKTTKALRKENSCKWIVSGTVEIKTGLVKKILDYGAGACDNVATLKVGPATTTITLP